MKLTPMFVLVTAIAMVLSTTSGCSKKSGSGEARPAGPAATSEPTEETGDTVTTGSHDSVDIKVDGNNVATITLNSGGETIVMKGALSKDDVRKNKLSSQDQAYTGDYATFDGLSFIGVVIGEKNNNAAQLFVLAKNGAEYSQFLGPIAIERQNGARDLKRVINKLLRDGLEPAEAFANMQVFYSANPEANFMAYSNAVLKGQEPATVTPEGGDVDPEDPESIRIYPAGTLEPEDDEPYVMPYDDSRQLPEIQHRRRGKKKSKKNRRGGHKHKIDQSVQVDCKLYVTIKRHQWKRGKVETCRNIDPHNPTNTQLALTVPSYYEMGHVEDLSLMLSFDFSEENKTRMLKSADYQYDTLTNTYKVHQYDSSLRSKGFTKRMRGSQLEVKFYCKYEYQNKACGE